MHGYSAGFSGFWYSVGFWYSAGLSVGFSAGFSGWALQGYWTSLQVSLRARSAGLFGLLCGHSEKTRGSLRNFLIFSAWSGLSTGDMIGTPGEEARSMVDSKPNNPTLGGVEKTPTSKNNSPEREVRMCAMLEPCQASHSWQAELPTEEL